MENPTTWTDLIRRLDKAIDEFERMASNTQQTSFSHDISTVYASGICEVVQDTIWPDLHNTILPTDPDWVIAKHITDWNCQTLNGMIGNSLAAYLVDRLTEEGFLS